LRSPSPAVPNFFKKSSLFLRLLVIRCRSVIIVKVIEVGVVYQIVLIICPVVSVKIIIIIVHIRVVHDVVFIIGPIFVVKLCCRIGNIVINSDVVKTDVWELGLSYSVVDR